jgi:hypothetical protein
LDCDEQLLKEQTEATKVTATKGPSKFQGKLRPHAAPSAPLPDSTTELTAAISDSGNAVAPLLLQAPLSGGNAATLAAGSGHAAALQSSSSQPWPPVSRDVVRRVNSLDSYHVPATSLQQVTDASVAAAEAKNARLRAQIEQTLNEIEQKEKEIAGWLALAAAAPAPPPHLS